MSRSKGILALAVIAAAAGITLLLLDRPPVETENETMAFNVSLYGYTERSALAWRVDAQQGRLSEGKGVLSGITLTFTSDGDATITATAETLIRGEGISRLTGGVRIEREDGLSGATEAVEWDESTDVLSTEAVSVTLDEIQAEAERLTYDLRSESAMLSGKVRADVGGDVPMAVTADRAEERSGELLADGNVTVVTEQETFRCERLVVDRRAETIELGGDVVMEFEDGRLTADRMRITPEGVTSSGAVSIRLGEDK